jgi:hypothetical protein
MGAWGSGPFESDEALDFLDALSEGPSWQHVRQAFSEALAADYLETTEASAAVAAVAIVVAARKGPAGLLDEQFVEDYGDLVGKLGPMPEDLLAAARAALAKVKVNSELAELWAESDSADEWLAAIDALDRGLA